MGEYALTFIDDAGKLSHASVHTGPINGTTLSVVSGQALALRTALDPILLGNIYSEELSAYRNKLQVLPPTNSAKRISRIRVTWTDTTQYLDGVLAAIANPNYQKIFTTHFPTADPSLFPTKNEVADLTASPWGAFVTAFQNLSQSDSEAGGTKVLGIILLDK